MVTNRGWMMYLTFNEWLMDWYRRTSWVAFGHIILVTRDFALILSSSSLSYLKYVFLNKYDFLIIITSIENVLFKIFKNRAQFSALFCTSSAQGHSFKRRPTDREKVFLENDSRKTAQRSKRSVVMFLCTGKYLVQRFNNDNWFIEYES